MPYKCEGSNLMHEKNGAWAVKQHCKDHASCLRAMRLLYAIEKNPDFKPRKG